MNDFARPIDIADGGRVKYGTDNGLIVEFHIEPVLMEAESKDSGHPIYEDRIYTRIVSPGNTKTTWDFLSRGIAYDYSPQGEMTGYHIEAIENDQTDPEKYPKAWERFLKKDETVKTGWDVREWGAITRSFAETLKSQNIHTVEALAELSDANVTNIMGGLKFRNLARAALDEQKLLELASVEQERANRAEEEKKELMKTIAAMQQQITQLTNKKHRDAA